MSAAAPEPPGSRAAGRAAGAAPLCIVCGYDLRAAPPEGHCPECGTAVERSLHGDWLRYADQRWVRAVHRGLRWTWRGVAAVLISIIALLVFVIGLAIIGAVSSTPIPSWFEGVFVVIVSILWLAGGASLALGLWLLSTPEPRTADAEPLHPVLLRTLSLAILPVIVLWLGLDTAFGVSLGLPPWTQPIITTLSVLIIGSQTWLLVMHLSSLERRCFGMDASRDRLLGKYRRQVLGVSISVVVLTFGTYLLMGRSIGAGIVIIAWIAVLGLTRETHRRVRFEMAILPEESVEASGDAG